VKNVTLTLDDQGYRAARIAAAERGKSLSALVRELLQSLGPAESGRERKAAALFAAMNRSHNTKSVGPLRREDLYDRNRLR
jgi:plasmid stability protein